MFLSDPSNLFKFKVVFPKVVAKVSTILSTDIVCPNDSYVFLIFIILSATLDKSSRCSSRDNCVPPFNILNTSSLLVIPAFTMLVTAPATSWAENLVVLPISLILDLKSPIFSLVPASLLSKKDIDFPKEAMTCIPFPATAAPINDPNIPLDLVVLPIFSNLRLTLAR